MTKKEKFYVTTTIPYANAAPHIGHALEFVQADVLARWNRLRGKDVFYLTGTDEHGTKNYQTAKKKGLEPQRFVDQNVEYFKELMEKLNITNDNFIRTTDRKEHWPGVVDMWNRLIKAGDIYEKEYEGSYCSGCERFVTEKDLVDGKCPNHPRLDIQKIAEKNYFFRLSKYSDEIKKRINSGELTIYPEKWKNSFLALIKNGLTDVSFSRDKKQLPWGIPVPGDDDQVMYVWCDALTNYLTGIGYPDKKYEEHWPADVHVVGKDMLRFHTGIWPGMLLSAGLPLPRRVIVHGFLTINGQKMSKSTGNVIDPIEIVDKYGQDALRYFFCRNFVFGEDGDISIDGIIRRHNDELANKLGNLVSRTSALAEKYGITKTTNALVKKLNVKKIEELVEGYEFDKALNEIFTFIDICNEFIQSKKPWETHDKKVLFQLVESIRKIAILLSPFIPSSAEKISEIFKTDDIKKAPVLFQKIEVEEKVNKEENIEEDMANVAKLEYKDWEKADLRVAEIKNIEEIDGADKLFKLTLDAGKELGERTVCAGIKQHYKAKDLTGKKIAYLSNLAPRKMRGIESQGMLLAAFSSDDSKIVLLTLDSDIENGSQIG
jgi:methionyl-tRNA synthetase